VATGAAESPDERPGSVEGANASWSGAKRATEIERMGFLVKVSCQSKRCGWLTESDVDESQCIGSREHAKSFQTRDESARAIDRLAYPENRHSFEYEIVLD
jgi:hypothetical protein